MRSRVIILLLLLAFQSAGYLLVFRIQQLRIKKEMKAKIKNGIADDQLVLLKILKTAKDDFPRSWKWIDEHEFRYEGDMYDIVRKQEKGDTVWYYCIPDEKESRLFANLDELINDSMSKAPERKKQNERLQRLFSHYYLQKYPDLSLLSQETEIEFSDYLFRLNSWICAPPLPPPKNFSIA